MVYNKLVRDKIPDIIRKQGENPCTRILDAEAYTHALEQKLEITGRLSEKYGRIKRLDDTANGNNKMRLMFEQYVLAALLDSGDFERHINRVRRARRKSR